MGDTNATRARQAPNTISMKLIAVLSSLLVTSSTADPWFGRPHLLAGLPSAVRHVPRGGAGILANLKDAVDDRSRKIADQAESKAAEFDEATSRLKDEALQHAQRELAELQREADRLSSEVDAAAKAKASELEKLAKAKAGEYATAAKEAAAKEAAEWESQAKKRAEEIEKLLRAKAAEVEKEGRRRAVEWANSLRGEDGLVFSGTLGSIFRRRPRVPPPPPPPPPLLSDRYAMFLAHGLLAAVALGSLSHLSGYPPALLARWEAGFGDKFLPFDAVTPIQKRLLAGAAEVLSIFLMRPKKTRAAGVGLIAAVYTWAAAVSIMLNQSGQAVALAMLSVLAWLLLANELL